MTSPDRQMPFGMPVRVVLGAVAILLALFLGSSLLVGSIEYGSCAGRMSRNCNGVALTTPLELAVGTTHLGTLLFALTGLALRPMVLLRRQVLVPTIVAFVLAHLAVVAIMLA